MKVIKEISAMQDISDYYRTTGKKIALVPTMGFLHEGHTSLILKARDENDIVVVSIFVNPLQFGAGEDFEKYPRDFARDYHISEKSGADYIFNPDSEEMYGKGSLTDVSVREITDRLEGSFRPGHFTGVATVVAKLINAIKPHRIYLGQKDAQQNSVIKRFIRDLNFDTDAVICETIREENGLAMSSRNSYLSSEERSKAAILFKMLNEGKRMILEENISGPDEVRKKVNEMLKSNAPGFALQYFEITDTEKLERIENLRDYKGEILISLAAKVGTTRLIDNIVFNKQ